MITVTVIYPKITDSWFDFKYYLEEHIPMVKSRLANEGLEEVKLLKGTAALMGGSPDFHLIAELRFTSQHQLQTALPKHGPEILADISRFTNVQPHLQINEDLTP
jgi:uncharacterized protein (TIGR02118 family)